MRVTSLGCWYPVFLPGLYPDRLGEEPLRRRMQIRPRRLALVASVLGVCAAVAVVVIHRQQGPSALLGAEGLGAEGTISNMLANQPFTQTLTPEIPDPHPDPDPYPYPGHPARSPTRGVVVHAMAPHKMTGLTLREQRNRVYASPHMGRAHGCKPEGITLVPGDDCDPLTAKMQPALARWESIRSSRQPTIGALPSPAPSQFCKKLRADPKQTYNTSSRVLNEETPFPPGQIARPHRVFFPRAAPCAT